MFLRPCVCLCVVIVIGYSANPLSVPQAMIIYGCDGIIIIIIIIIIIVIVIFIFSAR